MAAQLIRGIVAGLLIVAAGARGFVGVAHFTREAPAEPERVAEAAAPVGELPIAPDSDASVLTRSARGEVEIEVADSLVASLDAAPQAAPSLAGPRPPALAPRSAALAPRSPSVAPVSEAPPAKPAIAIAARDREPAPGVTPPSMPQRVRAAARSASEIVVTWAESSSEAGVAGYEIFREDEPLAQASTATFTDSGLPPWREHCYAVRAYDAAGNRSLVSKGACARTLDAVAPSAPGSLSAEAVSESDVTLSWAPSSDDVGVVGYEVAHDDGTVVATVAEARAHDGGLTAWSTYCYTVRARDAAGNWSAPSAPACAKTPDREAPSAPPSLLAKARNDTVIDLTWKPATDNGRWVTYEAFRDGARFAQTDVTTTYQAGLRPAQRYCFEVVAIDEAGNRSPPSSACATTPDLVPPTKPADFAVAAASSSEVMVEFKASTDDVGVTGYEVLRGSSVVAKVTSTFASVRGLSPGAEECYRVRAFDAAGNRSPEAGPLCARTTSDAEAPGAPRRLRASPIEAGVVLEWDPAPGKPKAYSISRENDRPLGATRGTTFTVRALKPGEKHCYRVAAIDDAGRFSPRSLPVCAAPGPTRTATRFRPNVAEGAPDAKTGGAGQTGPDPVL